MSEKVTKARENISGLLDNVEQLAAMPGLGVEAKGGAIVMLIATKMESLWSEYVTAVIDGIEQ